MQIDCVTNGKAAINAIRDEKVRYNAVFMDHMMPEMDGIEATRIIQEEIGTEYARNIPVIALTANALIGNEDMFLSKGFKAFIPKPIEVPRLDAVLRQWVWDEEQDKLLEEQKITVGGQKFIDDRTGQDRRSDKDRRLGYDRRLLEETIKDVNIKKGLARFNDDWETYLQVIKSFTVNSKPLLESMKTVNIENLSDYAIMVHGIKSSCRGIGGDVLGNKAEALEKASKSRDLDFVSANNPILIEAVFKLINDIETALQKEEKARSKPKKDKPYKEALLKLKTACENFQIDETEAAMEEIECFEYTSDNGLSVWLRENLEQGKYKAIKDKLSDSQ